MSCKFAEILEKNDKRSGKVLGENLKMLKPGVTALVKLVPQKLMCVETFFNTPG